MAIPIHKLWIILLIARWSRQVRHLSWGLLLCCSLAAQGASHGVILLYHHVATDTPPSTSVTPEQFTAHLDYLQEQGYRVVRLHDLLDAVYRNGPEVPENAVAITFDDAYASVFHTAYPMLKARGLPFTLFVATEALDRAYAAYLSWQQLRDMQASGLVDLGAHSVSHRHLLEGGGPRDDSDAWMAWVSEEIDTSIRQLESQVPGVKIRSFAYPFGEWHPPLAQLLRDRKLYGLAQHSGAVSVDGNRTAIPRYPIAQAYADEGRLRTALESRPLPAREIGDSPVLITAQEQTPERLLFELFSGPYNRTQLACYAASGPRLSVERQENHFSVILPALHAGRNKVNCTAPASDGSGAYYWFSRQWIVADPEGQWLTR